MTYIGLRTDKLTMLPLLETILNRPEPGAGSAPMVAVQDDL